MRGRAPQAARGRGRGAGAYGTRTRMQTLFGVLLCLPTVPGLPLWGTETSVRRRFCWAALGQAAACQYLLMWDVGRKEQWRVEKLLADLIR
jgi:hypothetical protein